METTELVKVEAGELIARTETPADRHPVAVYLKGLSSPGSRRVQGNALEVIARLVTGGAAGALVLDWSLLRYQHTQAIRAALAERYAPATANRMLAALKGALKEAWRLDTLPSDDYRRAVDLAPVRGETLPRGRALAAGELRSLFATCAQGGPLGVRDAALLSVCYGAGLRRSEAVALDLSDFDAETGTLTVRHGKGNKARVCYATNGGRRALEAWIALRGGDSGALFLPVNKGGKVGSRRLVDNAVLKALDALAERAGVTRFSPHDLRRTFISDLLDLGADIATVQRLAGHADVTTTARYDRRGEATKKRAAEMLHVPYMGAA